MMNRVVALPGVFVAFTSLRGSIWSSVFIVGAGAPGGGASGPCAQPGGERLQRAITKLRTRRQAERRVGVCISTGGGVGVAWTKKLPVPLISSGGRRPTTQGKLALSPRSCGRERVGLQRP